MTEEKNPVSEPLQKGAQAANAIRGAVKTGKAIAGAAKGAAAGGPYGAAAGFIWENRKLIGKIIIASVVIMMLPILFICMLPTIIFGGTENAFSPSNPDSPILNDSVAVETNIAEITSIVNSVLVESMTELLEQIDADFISSEAEQKEICIQDETLSVDTYRFIGQYCASKSEEPGAISLSDMENVLRQNKDKLYSYIKTTEERTTITTTVTIDPSTGEEVETTTSVTENWATYTVVFNGENYFANAVFHLTDEQKALAEAYAQNLTLFLNTSP